MRIVLASASPRRLQLCSQLGLDCVVRPVDIDEVPRNAEAPLDFVSRMAVEKTSACLDGLPGELGGLPVLGSDTVVEIDGDILGKPLDARHARRMLSRLSARKHHVHTAVALASESGLRQAISSTAVEFAELDDAHIDAYIRTGEPMDKAGSYAVQGIAARYIRRLEGSYTGVVGLPLYETARLFAESGIEI